MTVTDVLAVYAALLATGVAAWDVAKYFLERRQLRVSCYVAQMVTPGVGIIASDLLAYSIANTGGKPIVVTTVGGALRNGKFFMMIQPQGFQLPHTLQPGESMILTGEMPENIAEVRHFSVHDGLGKAWKASTKTVTKQLAAHSTKKS